jgi:hypothetical protein
VTFGGRKLKHRRLETVQAVSTPSNRRYQRFLSALAVLFFSLKGLGPVQGQSACINVQISKAEMGCGSL